MSKQVELACTVCAEGFVVPIGAYHEHAGVVPCPRCGSTDLVLLAERETVGCAAPACGSLTSR